MSATLSILTEWAEGWLPKEIHGGIKGRRGDTLHEQLMSIIVILNDLTNEQKLATISLDYP